MEGPHNSSTGNKTPSSHSTAANSQSPAPHDQIDSSYNPEHEDSPMRKRPRLDEGTAAASPDRDMTSDENHPQDSPQHSTIVASDGPERPTADLPHHEPTPNGGPQVVPSEVTLNLRSADTISASISPPTSASQPEQFQMNSDDVLGTAEGNNEPTPSPSSTLSATSIHLPLNSPVHSDQDAVVDIINESDDEAAFETNVLMNDAEVTPFFLERLLEEFPFAREHGYEQAAQALSEHVGREELRSEVLQQVGEWIQDVWLKHVNPTHDLQHFYLNTRNFWTYLASIYTKLMNRKSHLGSFISTGPGAQDIMTRRLRAIFLPYLRLCTHLIAVDLPFLIDLAADASTDPRSRIELISTRHLKNLAQLVRNPYLTPLFRALWEGNHIQMDQWQHKLFLTFIKADRSSAMTLLDFSMILLSELDMTCAFLIELDHSMFVSRFIGTIVRDYWQVTEEPGLRNFRAQLGRSWLQLCQSVESFLTVIAEKHIGISLDLCFRLLDSAACILEDVGFLDSALALPDVTSEFPGLHDVPSSNLPRVIAMCLYLRVCLTFITKSRMELRVAGLQHLAGQLIAFWRDLSNNHVKIDSPAYRVPAQWIVHKRLVEYLTGVNSHPQLISRSQDVTGYVMLTKFWTQSMTDEVWNTISTSEDPRVVSATLEMLGKILHLADFEIITAFCRKVDVTPSITSMPGLPAFLDKLKAPLLEFLKVEDSNTSRDRKAPLLLFIRIMCDVADQQPQSPDSVNDNTANMAHSLHNMALNSLQQLSVVANDSEDRKVLYMKCFEDVQSWTLRSTGSLEAIIALLSSHESQDKPFLIGEMDLLRRLAEDTCSFIDHQKRNDPNQVWLPALEPRLRLFAKLLLGDATPTLPDDVVQRLWSHLVGPDAFTDVSRDQAWKFLVEIVQSCQQEDPLVNKCITEFVWELPPQLFTVGMFNFVQQSAQYVQRVNPPSSPTESEPIEIPLVDLLWKIVLQAPKDTIERYASTLLSQLHLDTSLIKNAPASSIAATHTALVERCLDQLKSASKELAIHSNQSSENSTVVPMDMGQEQLESEPRFIRTLQFLKQFTQDVRNRPAFRDRDAKMYSPVAETRSFDKLDEQVELEYQVFKPGMKHEIKSLKMGASASVADLVDEIRRRTGIGVFKLFLAGSPFSPDEHAREKVESVQNKGILFVMSDESRKGSSYSTLKLRSTSVAERVLMSHFDSLYDFLTLPENLSSSVFDFLLDLPPHERVTSLVLEDKIHLQSLFPKGSKMKTLYSLKCIKDHLLRLVNETSDTDEYILKGVRVLTSALTSPDWLLFPKELNCDWDVVDSLMTCLSTFLDQPPTKELVASYMVNEAAIVDRLIAMLTYAMNRNQCPPPYDCGAIYGCLLDAAFHSRAVWEAFVNKPSLGSLHFWLLVTQIDQQQRLAIQASIESIFSHIHHPEAISSEEYISFFWGLLSGLVVRCEKYPSQCRELLATARKLLLNHQSLSHDEERLHVVLVGWRKAFSDYLHQDECPTRKHDDFVLGISKLLSIVVLFIKQSKKPDGDDILARICFDKYLFPPIFDDETQRVSYAESRLPPRPVVCSETRKELYNIVLALCNDNKSYQWLVKRLENLEENAEDDYPPGNPADTSRWLRGSIGYAGLTNLHNTCYMNSLLTQLFMNDAFRRFMVSVTVSEANGSQKLLYETQSLLANMQSSCLRFANTEDFARAVQPYDADRIDPAVQMDVDEFYNLLFDRLEGQMLLPAEKEQFRSLYGGQLVTQIKSKDCGHVSETVEPFMAIQCEVRGKVNLAESLHAYVQGDTMEGDNKYKCESCGGKFVNAVKRSCVKDLPDNLIFHLKRFDFDLSTFDRFKINDYFAFPFKIDMKQYGAEYLNDPRASYEPDEFELVGVLVHHGTAETGHYYSFVRLPQLNADGEPEWAEFNDTEVNEFDPKKIPEQCYGADYVHTKHFSAYMLFYRRIAVCRSEIQKASLQLRKGPEEYGAKSSFDYKTRLQNSKTIRQYCRFDPTHLHFLHNVTTKCKDIEGGSCSGEHHIEHSLLPAVLEHAKYVQSLSREMLDLESTILLMKKFVSTCTQCAVICLESIFRDESDAIHLMLGLASADARTIWADFILSLLETVKKHDSRRYGIDRDPDVSDFSSFYVSSSRSVAHKGVFFRVFHVLDMTIPHIGRYIRSWEEYFTFWANFMNLGIPELAFGLARGLFYEFLAILAMQDIEQPVGARLREVFENGTRYVSKHHRSLPRAGLVKVVGTFLAHVNPFTLTDDYPNPMERLRSFDTESRQFQVIKQEAAHLFTPRPNSPHTEFIVRVHEAWDTASDTEPNIPAQIVRKYVECASLLPKGGDQIVTAIGNVLAVLLDDYNTAYFRPILQSCLAFCVACPRIETVKLLLVKVTKIINSMKEAQLAADKNINNSATDFAPHGGANFTEFFTQLSGMPQAASGNEDPFALLVLELAYAWAPTFLVFDVKEVRTETVSILEHLIFAKYPFHLADPNNLGEPDVSIMDAARMRATKQLFAACLEIVHRAMQKRIPKIFVQQSSTILTQCATWCDKVLQEDPGVIGAIQERMDGYVSTLDAGRFSFDLFSECEEVLTKWKDFEPRLREWSYDTDGDGATSADTEYVSSGEEFSDSFTET